MGQGADTSLPMMADKYWEHSGTPCYQNRLKSNARHWGERERLETQEHECVWVANSYPVFFPVSFTPLPFPPAACYRKPSFFAKSLDSQVLKWQEAGRAYLLFRLYCRREPCRSFQASASLYRQGYIQSYDRC